MNCVQNMNIPTITNTQCVNSINKCVTVQKKLVIFDWDDTIFPTTALIHNKEQVTGAELEQFGQNAYSMLTKFVETFSAENIYIVTNGKAQWVQKSLFMMSRRQRALSGTDYWAMIYQLLATKLSGHVVSARALHGAAFPKQTALWKTLVFKQIAIEHFGAAVQSAVASECTIISIGDSTDEFIASAEAKKQLQSQFGVNSHLIRLHLKQRASRATMLKQFNVLSTAICSMTGDDQQSGDFVFN